ncbi:MAG: DMT family transporter [Buchnera aphidicola (Pentalonia nigronervosa)]|uniref:DMT family transporter n=1 Tax=Buchnera aphidicola (Pentalonia nigronervosa) TaxID=1309793 RepID=A0A7H1AZS1_9GAMM|nr:MAG: DMT family transporter [Buchnera aphidicola (Pentalonia nigronervosa)]
MNRIIILLLFCFISFTWGTTWIAMKIAIETIPPFFATGIRFLISSPILIAFAYFKNTPLLFPYGQRWFQLIISIFYFSIPFTLMLYGGIYVSSFVSSIIFANMPVAVLTVSYFYLKKKMLLIQKIGVMVSLITLFIILLIELESERFFQWQGILSLLLALFSHAMIYSECENRCLNISAITFNALPSLISGICLSIISFFIEHPHFNNFSDKSILALLYLGDFSGVFGILSYFYLQKKISTFYASIVFLVFPFISAYLENYIYQNTILFHQLWLIIPLFFGIFLTLIPKNDLK